MAVTQNLLQAPFCCLWNFTYPYINRDSNDSVGAVLFYIGPFRISRLIEQYKELVESDTSLA